MTGKALIVDLDDTIFQTRSMDVKAFEPFFNRLDHILKSHFSPRTITNIKNDLWENTWDDVLKKYEIPQSKITDAIQVFEEFELKLNISPYPDYIFLKEIDHPKFLVTTSVTSLQEIKIRALKIENDFTKVVINDPFKDSRTKLDIFKDLMREYNLIPEKTYVVGDNPHSEIMAGNSLNMITIQILRDRVTRGTNAQFYIKSFKDLSEIINQA